MTKEEEMRKEASFSLPPSLFSPQKGILQCAS
jgi:hypothetical protein